MKLPKVGAVLEDRFDASQLCHRKEWVSGVKSNDDVLLITKTTTRYFKPGVGHHDFYAVHVEDESQRKCSWCGVQDARWDEKCPVEQLHTHRTTTKTQRFYVVNGPKAGKFLTEEEAGDNYVSYNRSSRWRKKEGPYKVVLLALTTLKRKP